MGKALLSAWKPEESLFSQLLQGWTQAPPDPRHGGPKLLLDEQLRGTETSLLTVLLPWHLPKKQGLRVPLGTGSWVVPRNWGIEPSLTSLARDGPHTLDKGEEGDRLYGRSPE